MVITTVSQFDIVKLRKLIQQGLLLPEGSVRASGLPQADTGAFVTVDLSYSQEIGQSLRTFNGTTETIKTSCLSTVSISAYGNNGIALIQQVRSLLQSSYAMGRFKLHRWGLVRCSDVRNLSATVAGDYEERGQIELVISHEHIIQMPLNPIEQVDVNINNQIIEIRADR